MKYTCSMETVQQNGRFTLFSSKFPSNIYSISLDIPEYQYLLIDHVHSTVLVHNITCCGKYHRFQLISVTLLSLIWGKLILNWKSNLKNVLERKWVFATNSNFSLYILVTRWCRPLILETLNSGRSNFFWFTWFS